MEEAMARGGGGEHGYREQVHPRATAHAEALSNSSSPPPPPATMPFLSGLDVVALASEKKQKQEHQPAASLPEDLLIEILARVPYKSLCRFKCVSKPWLALCFHPEILRRSPQTLSGFFYNDRQDDLRFLNLSGRGPPMVDPSLSFLRSYYEDLYVEQCCTSLLLCRCWTSTGEDKYDFVVCNPATQKWTVLPPIQMPNKTNNQLSDFHSVRLYLGFDLAVPSRFVVFAPPSDGYYDQFTEVMIYSSETGRWTSMQSEWNCNTILVGSSECVFLNGAMHLPTHYPSIVTVGMEGKAWKQIAIPENMPDDYDDPSIGQSQGRLYAWYIDYENDYQLSIWVLEDYGSGQWTLKHTVNVLELFGRHCRKSDTYYKMFAIHPECNLIFLTDQEKIVSYDMDYRKVHDICISGELEDGLPYIPCFSEWSSDGH